MKQLSVVSILRKELKRVENERERIAKALTALEGERPRRVLSKDARRRIGEAQRKRWAKSKARVVPFKKKAA